MTFLSASLPIGVFAPNVFTLLNLIIEFLDSFDQSVFVHPYFIFSVMLKQGYTFISKLTIYKIFALLFDIIFTFLVTDTAVCNCQIFNLKFPPEKLLFMA
jgi:hypothetical protein